MAIFKYTAKNSEGKTVKGEVEAYNENSAAGLLKKKGHLILSITLVSKRTFFSIPKIFGGVSINERVNFTNQLAVMLSSGLNLGQSLEILAGQADKVAFKKIIGKILRDVEGGAALSSALQKHPKVFNTTYVSLIRAGEAGGGLDRILTKLAINLEKQRDLRGKIKGALVYPVIISIAMIGVVTIIMIFVVPKLTDMYTSLNVELPLPTKILIGLSNFLVKQWYVVLLIIAGAFFLFKFYKKTTTGAIMLARISLKLPIFGKLMKQKEMTEFSGTLALLTASGVPIVESLAIVSESLGNVIYRDQTKDIAQSVQKGFTLSESIKKGSDFPNLISQMVSVGEETGKIDEILGKVAAYYEMEVDRIVKNLSTALEPIIMLFLGGVVGLLIISIITPIYKLTSSF